VLTSTRRRCAVLGSPIAHSLSPVLHRAAYRELGLDWSYDAVELTAAGLPAFVEGLDGTWRGLSLTMPLKRTVLPLLDELAGRAREAAAVNTVVLDEGRRVGHNTDVPGAVAALRERYDGPAGAALVLGAGATAASTVLALADLGCRHVLLAAREPRRAAETLDAVARHPHPPDVEVVRLDALVPDAVRADVLVSTIPASAQPRLRALVDRVAAVFDVVYDPWPTPLAQAALARTTAGGQGPVLVGGLDLLVHQAALQVELMTGVPEAPLALMRAAGEAALAARAQ
jgi:shikimate dehydrogenase